MEMVAVQGIGVCRRFGVVARFFGLFCPRITFANCLGDGQCAAPEACRMLDTFRLIDPSKQWFTAKEVAALLDRTDQFVRDLIEHRRILGHALCARGSSERKSYQIHRSAIELYLLQTANFQPDEYVRQLLGLAKRLPRQQREWLRSHL
jgi:hypothetical protein